MQFHDAMVEDMLHERRILLSDMSLPYTDAMYDQGVLATEDHMNSLTKSRSEIDGFVLPKPNQ